MDPGVLHFAPPVATCTLEGGGSQDGRESARPGASALPCLYSHNSNERIVDIGEEEGGKVNKLKGSHKRTAHVLCQEIQGLARRFGIERLGFLTLTFADQVTQIREASRRFNSLATGILKGRYERAIGVVERQESGRIHFHLVVVLGADIRTGFDWREYELALAWAKRHKQRPPKWAYRSANQALRSEWVFWRSTAPRYRFGRTELLPVKSTAEGIARYVGKYVSKHVRQRSDHDKGARAVRYLGYQAGHRVGSSVFGWATTGGWLWRAKLAAWAKRNGVGAMEDLTRLFGPRWAYALQWDIMATPVQVFSGLTFEEAMNKSNAAQRAEAPYVKARADWERREMGPGRVYALKPDQASPLDKDGQGASRRSFCASSYVAPGATGRRENCPTVRSVLGI